jgi:membrane protein DedA with SNARE-associated domain
VTIIAALFEIPGELGYLALALFVGIEASGVPVPGETALITASVLASQGELSIVLVIGIAAAAAIVGDNVGYAIGSRVGRRVMEKPGRYQERRLKALARGDHLFERHGPKAVFFGRWIALLRIWASWLAGMTSMRWSTFLLWIALGGIGWALCFGLIGYFGGRAAAELIARLGVGAAILAGLALAIGWFVLRRRARWEH